MDLIKLFSFTILLFLSGLSYAQESLSESQKVYLKKALNEYKAENYKTSLYILESNFNFNEVDHLHPAIIKLGALVYNKMNQPNKALKLYTNSIKKQFAAKNQEVLKAYSQRSVDDVEVPEKLLSLYYDLAKTITTIYTTASKNPQNELYEAAVKYWQILSDKEFKEDEADQMLEKLSQHKDLLIKSKNQWAFYLQTSLITWQEELASVNTSNNSNVTLLSTNRGTCIGGGVRYFNYFSEFMLDGCAMRAVAAVGSKDSSYTYFQKNVPISGGLAKAAYLWRVSENRAAVGFALPIFVRNGQYDELSNQSIQGKGLVTTGLLLHSRLEWNHVALATDLGKLSSIYLLLITLQYHF